MKDNDKRYYASVSRLCYVSNIFYINDLQVLCMNIAAFVMGIQFPYIIKNINVLGCNMIFIFQYDKNATLFL